MHGVQEEMTDEDFAKSVEELAKNQLQKPKKLSTLAGRWLPEVLLARGCWDRVEREVAELRQLRRADIVAFVDSALMPDSNSCRRLCVHVKGAAERAAAADRAAEGGEAAEGEGDAAGGSHEAGGGPADAGAPAGGEEIVVQAEDLAAFRMSQQLWPAARQSW